MPTTSELLDQFSTILASVPALPEKFYRVDLGDDTIFIHGPEKRVTTEPLTPVSCTIKTSTLALEQLLKRPDTAVLLLMKKELVVEPMSDALELAVALKSALKSDA